MRLKTWIIKATYTDETNPHSTRKRREAEFVTDKKSPVAVARAGTKAAGFPRDFVDYEVVDDIKLAVKEAGPDENPEEDGFEFYAFDNDGSWYITLEPKD